MIVEKNVKEGFWLIRHEVESSSRGYTVGEGEVIEEEEGVSGGIKCKIATAIMWRHFFSFCSVPPPSLRRALLIRSNLD